MRPIFCFFGQVFNNNKKTSPPGIDAGVTIDSLPPSGSTPSDLDSQTSAGCWNDVSGQSRRKEPQEEGAFSGGVGAAGARSAPWTGTRASGLRRKTRRSARHVSTLEELFWFFKEQQQEKHSFKGRNKPGGRDRDRRREERGVRELQRRRRRRRKKKKRRMLCSPQKKEVKWVKQSQLASKRDEVWWGGRESQKIELEEKVRS